MQRFLMEGLVEWKNKNNRKPLILKGARQVGKTWLMKEFGKLHFEKCAYVSFYNNQRMKRVFFVMVFEKKQQLCMFLNKKVTTLHYE